VKLGEYIASKAVTLCFLVLGALMLGIFMSSAGSNAPLVCLAELLLLLTVLAWLCVSYVAERAGLKKLERIMAELPDHYLLGETLPKPLGAVERQYFGIMKAVSRSAVGVAEQARREKDEYCDYVESWIHEIKTPLTACSLILSNDGDIRKLKRELKRADNLTESILYYARMRSVEKDTQIREIRVAEVMDEAVRSQMELLVAAGIGVELRGDFSAHTDGKSLCFILKQLLINSAKYCPGCHVTMQAGDGAITVADNGVGIPAHELRRVTERGFTGESGRRLGGGTGMGLYIVGGLCRQLGISLEIQSEPGRYTSVRLSFDSLTKL
jgi:signal transduction histidine kinase